MSNYVMKAFQRVLAKSEGQIPVLANGQKQRICRIEMSIQKFLKENDICFQVMRNPDYPAIH